MNHINNFSKIQKQKTAKKTRLESYILPSTTQPFLLQELLEDLINGVLIVTEAMEIIYTSESARRILRQINPDSSPTGSLPQEICHICQFLIESRKLFPEQYWMIESKVVTEKEVAFTTSIRWIKLDTVSTPCLILIMEDEYQNIRNMALAEAQMYGLTDRETEVWLLHRANYTYNQIAVELNISPNTVKKHLKSVHVKQQAT